MVKGGGRNSTDFDVDQDYFGEGGDGAVEAKLDLLTSQLADVTAALKALAEGGSSGVLSPATSLLSEDELGRAAMVDGSEAAIGAEGGHGGSAERADVALHQQVTGAIHRRATKMRQPSSMPSRSGSAVKDSAGNADAHPKGER